MVKIASVSCGKEYGNGTSIERFISSNYIEEIGSGHATNLWLFIAMDVESFEKIWLL